MIKKGRKLVCKNCEGKFYTLGKTKNLNCPICGTEYNLDEELNYFQGTSLSGSIKSENKKDEFSDIENTDNAPDDDEVISLDEAEIEEQAKEKN